MGEEESKTMWITTYRGEKHLSELAGRLFAIEGPESPMLAAKVEEALLQTNPHLGNLDHIPEGTPIVVPDVPGVEPAKGEKPANPIPNRLFDETARSLNGIVDILAAAADRKSEAARNTLQWLDAEIRRARANQDVETEKRLIDFEAEAKARLSDAEAFRARHQDILGRMKRDFNAFE